MRVNAEVCYLYHFTPISAQIFKIWALLSMFYRQGWTKKVFFTEQTRPKMYDAGRGWGLNLQGRAHTAYIPYTTAEETLVCIALGEVSQIYLKFIIIVQCCHIVSLWLSWIGKIRECYLLFCPAITAPRFLKFLRCGAARVFHGAGQGTPLSLRLTLITGSC